MSTQIQLEKDEILVTKCSYDYPGESFHSITRVPSNRPWWKFWTPKYKYMYTVIEKVS